MSVRERPQLPCMCVAPGCASPSPGRGGAGRRGKAPPAGAQLVPQARTPRAWGPLIEKHLCKDIQLMKTRQQHLLRSSRAHGGSPRDALPCITGGHHSAGLQTRAWHACALCGVGRPVEALRLEREPPRGGQRAGPYSPGYHKQLAPAHATAANGGGTYRPDEH